MQKVAFVTAGMFDHPWRTGRCKKISLAALAVTSLIFL
jgi:hypothetical protein